MPKVLPRQVTRFPMGILSGRAPARERPAKPHRDDTPYRSAIHVAASHSTDGNAYAKGEPIPEAEHLRQVQRGIIPAERKQVKNRPTCPKCKGTGKRNLGGRQHKSHKWNCPCVACMPCKVCDGAGRIEVA